MDSSACRRCWVWVHKKPRYIKAQGLVITIDTLSKTKISPVLGDGDREFSSKSASEVIQVRTLEGNPV